MSRRGFLPAGAGAVRCSLCGAEARADGRGTPIVLRHSADCPEGPGQPEALEGTIVGTVNLSGLEATGMVVGPDDVLVILFKRGMSVADLYSHRETVADALGYDRFILLAGADVELVKVDRDQAHRIRKLQAGGSGG